jgi:hypothetical protein
LSEDRSAEAIGKAIVESFQRRHEAAQAYNKRLDAGEIKPAIYKRIFWTVRGNYDQRFNNWKSKDGRRKASLTLAMNDSVFWWFWIGGILKLVADVAQMTSPLLVKEIIKFAQKSYAAHLRGTEAPPLGIGVGLCFALLALQIFSSWGLHHSFYRGSTTGVVSNNHLISMRRSLTLMIVTSWRAHICHL